MQKRKDMAHGNGGANTADSYIGSLISLTSKSEIRYEGILYTVDTENSNIALQNVRSFGTEGRKKDGLPIYASDKVYDYIIFRGSDIKDLQVKSSPSIQTLPQPPSDPAIISLQSQYSQSASIAPAYVQQSLGQHDAPPQLPYPGLSPSGYRSSVPQLYQSTAAWGTPLPTGPNANLAMPMYWQGYYRAPAGQHVMHQQIGPQPPPPSLPQPPKAHPSQPQVPFPHDHPQAPSTEPQALVSSAQPQAPLSQGQAVQQVGSRPMPSVDLSDSGALATFAPQKAIAPSSSSFPAVISSAPASLPVSPGTPINPLSSGTATNLLQPSAVFASFPATASATLGPSIPLSLALGIPAAMQGVSAVITPAAKNPRRLVVHPQSPSTNASCNRRSETITHPLPGGFPALDESSPFSIAQKQESKTAVKPQNAISSLGQTLHQQTQPLLPLPNATALQKQGNGIISPTYVRRGRGRPNLGRGRAMGHAQQFTEDFDFLAMNERFNKNEVWGVLGSKGESREKVTDVDEELVAERNEFSQISDGSTQKGARKKPIYVKDNFFDSLSCDALDREGGRAERTKFSEQRKIDTETFGNFPLRARGGRRSGHRGGFRGAYYGGGGYTSGKGSGYGRGRGTESAMAIK